MGRLISQGGNVFIIESYSVVAREERGGGWVGALSVRKTGHFLGTYAHLIESQCTTSSCGNLWRKKDFVVFSKVSRNFGVRRADSV